MRFYEFRGVGNVMELFGNYEGIVLLHYFRYYFVHVCFFSRPSPILFIFSGTCTSGKS